MAPQEDLESAARDLVKLYRDVVRVVSPDEAVAAGKALGRALEALERVRHSSAAVAMASIDMAEAREALVRLRVAPLD